jgi:predicted DNA-binding transcriptional regulator YafY
MTPKMHSNLPETQKLDGMMKAISENRTIHIKYQRDYGKDEVTTVRRIKPSHIYVYNDGTAYVKAHCTLKKAPRTFQIGRIAEMGLGETVTRKEALVMYPASWNLRKAIAQTVKNIEPWAKAGWSSKPVVITEPV